MMCTVCGAANPETATICSSCKAFLQNRIPTLDLFETAWGCLVAPGKTFHEIVIAEHKNYALTLFGFSGIPLLASTIAALQAGQLVGGLIETAALATAAGFVVGIVSGLLMTLLHWQLAGLLKGDKAFQRSLGIVAYALVPAMLVGLLIFPIQLMTFGEHWFSANPHPATINPVSYWTLQALQWGAILWTLALLAVGNKAGIGVGTTRATILMIFTAGLFAAGWWWSMVTLLGIAAARVP